MTKLNLVSIEEALKRLPLKWYRVTIWAPFFLFPKSVRSYTRRPGNYLAFPDIVQLPDMSEGEMPELEITVKVADKEVVQCQS